MIGRSIQKALDEGKDPFFPETFKTAKFRSARSRVKKTVKIKADGTW